MSTWEKIIKDLELMPHPEGGFYRETYRSPGMISKDNLSAHYTGKRNYSTCIYFLLTSDVFSAFHRIIQDEIWHFYNGSPLYIHMITPEGVYSKVFLGSETDQGQVPQFIIPGGTWFAATVVNSNDYSLVGCTVSPGYDFDDLELADRRELISRFPQHSDVILQLTRE